LLARHHASYLLHPMAPSMSSVGKFLLNQWSNSSFLSTYKSPTSIHRLGSTGSSVSEDSSYSDPPSPTSSPSSPSPPSVSSSSTSDTSSLHTSSEEGEEVGVLLSPHCLSCPSCHACSMVKCSSCAGVKCLLCHKIRELCCDAPVLQCPAGAHYCVQHIDCAKAHQQYFNISSGKEGLWCEYLSGCRMSIN